MIVLNRKKKLALNTGAALIYQVTTLICGFILPQFLIPYFGSATNGLINSITQFLTIITLCECGVGAVVQSALYKPLAENDNEGISKVVISSNRFFGNIMRILCVYVVVLGIVYPFIVKDEFDYLYTASLIVIIALSYIAQYYLFLTYRLLLNADQASFIQLTAHSVSLIVNTVASILLIKVGVSVHLVKFVSALAFLIQPVVIKIYVDRHYQLNLKLKLTEDPLPQKWNGLAQHMATVVYSNVATVLLTLFGTLEEVSIYGVYYLIAHGIRQVIVSLNTGIQAMLGNMYAKKETEVLNNTYGIVEFAFHTVVTLVFTIAGILLIPFIKIYTINFTDANYIQPLFGVLMILSQAAYCIRIPYEMMIKAAGHYKQTQTSSIIEAVICVIVSLATVWCFGLVGVAIGMLVAMCYRTVYLVFYLSKNIIHRKTILFVKQLLVNLLSIGVMIVATYWINLSSLNYFSWFIMAIEVGVICLIICILVNIIFFRKMIINAIKLFVKKKRVKQ